MFDSTTSSRGKTTKKYWSFLSAIYINIERAPCSHPRSLAPVFALCQECLPYGYIPLVGNLKVLYHRHHRLQYIYVECSKVRERAAF